MQPPLQCGERLEHRLGICAAARAGVCDLCHLVLIHRHPVIAEDALRSRDRAVTLRPLVHHRHIFQEHIAAGILGDVCKQRRLAHALPGRAHRRSRRAEAELLRKRRHAQSHELWAELHTRRLRIFLHAVFEQENGRRLRPRKAGRLYGARILPAEVHGLHADLRGDGCLPSFELFFKFRAIRETAAAVCVTAVKYREVHAEQLPILKFDDGLLHRDRAVPDRVVAEESRLFLLRREPLRARGFHRRLELIRRHLPRVVARDQRIEHHRRGRGRAGGFLRAEQRRCDEEHGHECEDRERAGGVESAHGFEEFAGILPLEMRRAMLECVRVSQRFDSYRAGSCARLFLRTNGAMSAVATSRMPSAHTMAAPVGRSL